MSQSGVIITRKASCMIPNDFLELVLKENPHGMGITKYSDEGMENNKFPGDEVTLDFLQETMKTFMDEAMTMHFVNSPNALNLDDVPPYILVGDDEEPELVCFIEGEFPGFVKKDSTHPDTFFYINEFLIPKVKDIAELVDDDIDKIMKAIEKPTFKKEALVHSTSRGVLAFVAGDKTVYLSNADDSAEFDWGWASKTYGYGKTQKAEPEKKAKAAFPKRSTVREPAAAAKQEEVPDIQQKIADDIKSKADAKPKIVVKKAKPPANWNRKDRGLFYKHKIGFKPIGWQDSPEVDVYVDESGKILNLRDIEKLGLSAAAIPKLNNKMPHEPQDKDVTPEHIPQVSGEVLPIISPQNREWIQKLVHSDKVKKIIAENAEVVTDPRLVQKQEERIPSFVGQLGKTDIKEVLPWMTVEVLEEIGKHNLMDLVTMCFNLRNIVAASAARVHQRIQEQKEVHTVAQEELKPKKTAFPKRDVA